MRDWLRTVLCVGFGLTIAALNADGAVMYWPTALDLAKQRAVTINCVNNLHQIRFAAAAWSATNGDQFPTGFQAFTNELTSPGFLFCPADVSRPPATNWSNFDWARIHYQWISVNPNGPDAVCCRRIIHSNEVFVSGYVRNNGKCRDGWPAIVAAPVAQDLTPGSDARFEVRLAPNALSPVRYQWRREQLYFITNITFIDDPTVVTGLPTGLPTSELPIWLEKRIPSFIIHNSQTNVADYYSVRQGNITQLGFTLISLKTNTLEASTDLLNWTALANYTGTNGSFWFYDTNSASRRFYRLRAY